MAVGCLNKMARQFQKRVEDFVCEECGAKVVGSGYTNHCPVCLASKHVDVHPGDRAAECGGLMYVVRVDFQSGGWRLLHQCRVCGHEKWNTVADGDSQEKLAEVARRLSTDGAR